MTLKSDVYKFNLIYYTIANILYTIIYLTILKTIS
jgi:hypothetical protein